MQLTPVNNTFQNKKNGTPQPSFSNGGAMLSLLAKPLQSMDTNPIAGVIFLDITSAIAPNTAIDTVKRNPDQGFETFRRESSGLIINCILPGIAAPVVGYLFKKGILGNAFSGIASHKIWANKDTIDETAATWKKVSHIESQKDKVTAFINESFKKIQANSQSRLVLNEDIAKPEEEKALAKLVEAIFETDTNEANKSMNRIHGNLAKVYGESKSVTIKGDTKTYTTSLKNYIRDTFAMSKAFMDKSITNQDKAITNKNVEKFAVGLKKLLKFKSVATMAGVGALALSMQAINRRMTEKMTGRKGYSGYKDLSIESQPTAEEKKRLRMGKLLSTAWFGSLAFISMGKFSPGMFNFAAPTTTMNQARGLSLLTDVGRVNAADDKNELKDTTIRDTVIFMNLYVLGDYVQKGVVEWRQKAYKEKYGVDLNLMNEAKKSNPNDSIFKKIGNWVTGKSVKSFEEIEGTATNLLKDVKTTQLRKNIITAGNLAGIGYSLVALGIFTPLLIARMTNHNREKQIAKAKSSSEMTAKTQIEKGKN